MVVVEQLTSAAAAVAYVDRELFASVRSNPGFSRFDVAHSTSSRS